MTAAELRKRACGKCSPCRYGLYEHCPNNDDVDNCDMDPKLDEELKALTKAKTELENDLRHLRVDYLGQVDDIQHKADKIDDRIKQIKES